MSAADGDTKGLKEMGKINGTFITEIDGIKYYTDGIVHNNITISANVAYVQAGYQKNLVDGSWSDQDAITSFNGPLVISGDNDGNIQFGASAGVFNAGVVRYSDGTNGVFLGAGFNLPGLLGIGISIDGTAPRHRTNLQTQNSMYVMPDGTLYKTEYMPGDMYYPGIKVKVTAYKHGVQFGDPQFTNIPDPSKAGPLGAGVPQCFPAATLILTSSGQVPIEAIRVGDSVLAYEAIAGDLSGQLTPRKVTRLFQNVTKEWIELDLGSKPDGQRDILTCTPGHHFLDEFGNYPAIAELLLRGAGKARIVMSDGELREVSGRRIAWSEEAAELFGGRARIPAQALGGLALAESGVDAWQTYNFEVEDLHTYIAGGVRVHNISDLVAHNRTGVDDWGAIAVAYNVPGYGNRALNGVALDYYYNSLGGAKGFAGTALGWGLTAAAAAQLAAVSSYFTQGAFTVAYAEMAGKYNSADTTRYLAYSAAQYVRTANASHETISERGLYQSLGPARYGEKLGSPEHIADRAFARGYSYLEAYAALAGVSIYSDPAYRAYEQHRAQNTARLAGSSRSSSSSDSKSSFSNSSKSWGGRSSSDYGPSPSGNWSSSTRPVLLDVSGNGLSIETLSTSSKFLDLDGDGYQHRTAWAGTGTGVLVIDADADGKISRSKEFAFTEWDPSATSDLEALKHVFDTNANGKLDSGDAQWSKFRVEVNGQLVTLDSLGITSIDLTPKGSGQTFEDGSAITGTTTFTRADGSTGTVGDAKLANDDAAHVVKTTSVTNPDNSVEKTIFAYNADGSLAFRNLVTTSADGRRVQTQFDDDGNGTFDRSQTNVVTVDVSGVQTKTVSNFNADGSLADRTTTVTSDDHLSVTTTLDQDGDGIINQRQTYVQNADGSTATTTEQLSVNGTLLTKTMVTSSANGLVKANSLDRDGNGTYDTIVTETTTVAADGSRGKTTKEQSASGKTLSAINKTTSADGRTISIYTDSDGNGPSETRTDTISTVATDTGNVTLETTLYNTNASFIRRSKTTTITSANGLSKTVKSDVNADNINDFTDTDITVVDASYRTQTVQHRSGNNTLLSQTITKTSIDGKTITITEDANGDTKTDKLTEILVGTDGKTTNTVSTLNTDGWLISKTATVTSTDGLSKTTSSDANGDGTYDLVVSDVITNETNGSRTETVTTKNANGATTATTVTNTTADSLTQTVKTDANGDSVFEETTTDIIVLDGAGKRTETVTSRSADGTLNAQTNTEVSADRRTTTVWTDADGDGKIDTRQIKVIAADGSTTTTETEYTPNDTVTGTTRSTVTVSGNGLTTTTSIDLNRDSIADRITTEQTVLNTDGSTTETIAQKSSNATLLDKKAIVTSGNDMSITTSEDLNGDGVVDTKSTDVTTFDTYGLQFQTVSDYRGTTLVGTTKVTTNLNGLSGSTDYDLDGDGTVNQTLSWKKTPIDPSGVITSSETVRATDTAATLISQKITTVSADQKTTTISSKIDADAVVDRLETITIDDAGTKKDEVKQYKASGALESQAVVTTSDDGLSKTSSSDLDGNGVFELVTTDVTVLNADGSRTKTISKKGIADALISRTTASVSASGLSKTTSWADASGNPVRSMSDVTVLNADGGTTQTLSYFKANGTTLESQTVTTVAAHGLSATVTIDVDGNGTIDKKSVTSKQADGSTVQTFSDFSANVLKNSKKVTASADGLTQAVEYDSGGNGTIDKKTTSTTALNANGSKTTTVKDFVGSVTKSITATDVSGDGLTTTTKWDTTGTGGGTTFNKSRTDVILLNADGSKTQTISNLTGTTLTSRTLVTTSATGLSVTTQIDPTGAGTYSQTATDVTVLNADGTKTRTVESKKTDGSLISKTTTVISANDLIVGSSEERPGFTNQTATDTTTVLADGAIRETVETKGSTGAVIGKVVTLTSADKLTVTVDRDGNGDGILEQRQQTVTANSGIQTSVTTNFKADGKTVRDKSTTVVSADGRQKTTTWDFDGNGTSDRQRVTNLTSNADGSSTTVISDKDLPAGTVTAKTTIQTSADGRVMTTVKDINVDNTPDHGETTTIDATGASVTTVSNNATARAVSNLTPGVVYWKQAIAAKIETTTSADGRTEVAKYDYDGNGVYETVMQSTTQVDGSVITTVTETGTAPAKGTISTSADGLVTTLSKDTDNNGSIDHVETAVTHADGSITLNKKDANAIKQTVVEEVRSTGTLASRKTTDLGGLNWTYSDETFDGWGRAVTNNVVYDDGTRLSYRYDAANANSWWKQQYSYTGTTLNWLREFWDNGTLTHRQYDYNPNNNYWQIANDEYADGTLIQQTKYFDNGNYDVIRNGVTYHYNASGDPIGPVLLDLDDDGHVDLRPIDLSNMAASPTFDWDGDGVRDTTAWAGPSDGFLAIDLASDGTAGPDGKIDQAKELAFSLWAEQDGAAGSISDLDGVRLVFDTNHDNVLNSDDERWNEFRVWRDANQDGLTDQGELLTMTDAGIKLINLMPTRDGSQAFADGSIITGTSSYETLDGSKHLVADASLIYRPTNAA
ncbi:Hint domain-containing protein [Rhizobium acaciae]|uniref:Hint domain-containing protein n=1 Tax=Rhizobium acaciae TaxID=2989736 RepID=UPI00221F8B63|nr:Hint domain-containing protein [Rhizobium acaciae]MCW1754959.1 Hint domain-containing protein [Rhizobium acaciae]